MKIQVPTVCDGVSHSSSFFAMATIILGSGVTSGLDLIRVSAL